MDIFKNAFMTKLKRSKEDSSRYLTSPNVSKSSIMWCSIRNFRMNKFTLSSAPKMFLPCLIKFSNLCIKSKLDAGESSSQLISNSKCFKISEYVARTLVRTELAICSVTQSMNAAWNDKLVSMELEELPCSIPFTPADVRKPFNFEEFCLNQKSTWRLETRKSCLYPTSKLLYPIRSWFLRKNSFLRVAPVGGKYTAIPDDKYTIVNYFSSLQIPR